MPIASKRDPWRRVRRCRIGLLLFLVLTIAMPVIAIASRLNGSRHDDLLTLGWFAFGFGNMVNTALVRCPNCGKEFFLKQYPLLVWVRYWASRCQSCNAKVGSDLQR